MFDIIETNKSFIYAIGDIHGEFKSIANWIKICDLSNCALIFCGDFGLGFTSVQKEHDELSKAQKLCEERDIDCYIIRGNHDDPEYYNGTSKNLVLSRFKPLSDYTVIKSPQHNILCLGGAVSIDRSRRISFYQNGIQIMMLKRHLSYNKARDKVKPTWWENEGFVYNEEILKEIIKSGLNIDVICSHSVPENAYPILSNQNSILMFDSDSNLKFDIKRERENLSSVLDFLKKNGSNVLHWYYGHFHEHNTENIDGMTFHLLDMGRHGKGSSSPGGCFDMTIIY